MLSVTNDVYSVLLETENAVSCKSFFPLWDTFKKEGICADYYTGFLLIWISQFSCSFLLFVLVVIQSFTYQYFDWRIEFGEEEEAAKLRRKSGNIVTNG